MGRYAVTADAAIQLSSRLSKEELNRAAAKVIAQILAARRTMHLQNPAGINRKYSSIRSLFEEFQ